MPRNVLRDMAFLTGWGYTVLFLHFCDLGVKNATRLLRATAFLTGCFKQSPYIPPRTDTVVRFALEHAVLFYRLCYLGNCSATGRSARHGVAHGGRKKCLTEYI